MAGVTIRNVSKSYGDVRVIHGIDLEIADGDFVVFVGPSGCGKSTLLRMIAGLEDITEGTISIGERVVNDVAPSKRGVAMVFQTYALYPHMTVYKNMAFGLKQARMPKDEIDRRVRSAAERLQLKDLLDRPPRALSGGQRQRVAIGRAIVREPLVFLFDEPLSNLDAALRVQTRLLIARLHERLDTTMIYVTHDQVEAMTLADRIVVLRDGRVEQAGSPVELYEKPENTFVAQFIGSPKMNFFSSSDLAESAPDSLKSLPLDSRIIGVRPEHLRVCGENCGLISARLELIEHLGEYVLAHLLADSGREFIAKMEKPPTEQKNSVLSFTASDAVIHLFDRDSGQRAACGGR